VSLPVRALAVDHRHFGVVVAFTLGWSQVVQCIDLLTGQLDLMGGDIYPITSWRSSGRITASGSRVHGEYPDCRAVRGCTA
jgi:hypothetical protein